MPGLIKIISGAAPPILDRRRSDQAALILRLGLGAVFVIGGWWKLSRALDPARAGALVERYMAANGYINAFFSDYLFAGPLAGLLTPLGFLTALSAFELTAGLALMAGFLTRGLSLVFAFLLWSFVMALPVVTAPGAAVDGATHASPALLVQIRDIGLSGMFFVLLALGAGAYSVDQALFRRGRAPDAIDWSAYGLLLRLSVASVFLVGGVFAGLDHIKSYAPTPLLLIAIGAVLASGRLARPAAILGLVTLAAYIAGSLSVDASLWGNLNAIKREIAFAAALGVLAAYGGGRAWRFDRAFTQPAQALLGRRR